MAVVAVAIVAAAALIVGSIVLGGGSSSPEATSTAAATTADTTSAPDTPEAVSLVAGIPQRGTMLGNPSASVRLLQFEDLQCPICRKYTENAFPAIVEEYIKPGRLRIDFRGIAFLGPDSEKALRIAVAAGFQNKLWEVVGLFYANQGDENSGWVTNALIDEILTEVPGLDAAKVKVDAKSPAVTKAIKAVQAEATKLQVPGTPWFYVGVGLNAPYEIRPTSLTPGAFRPALDDALNG